MDQANKIKELVGRRFIVDDKARRCVIIQFKNEAGDLCESEPQPMGVLVENKPQAQGEFAY